MNKEKVIQEVENFVRNNPPKSRGTKEIYIKHVWGVRKYAVKLAEFYNTDKFVVELAALLHDAAGDTEENHAEEGAEKSKEILSKLGVPKGIREKVSQCIKTHSMGSKAETLEAQILQDADGIFFVKENYRDFFNLFKEKLPLEQVRKTSIQKTKGMVKKIKTEEGKKLAEDLISKAIEYLKSAT